MPTINSALFLAIGLCLKKVVSKYDSNDFGILVSPTRLLLQLH